MLSNTSTIANYKKKNMANSAMPCSSTAYQIRTAPFPLKNVLAEPVGSDPGGRGFCVTKNEMWHTEETSIRLCRSPGDLRL